MKMRRLGRTGPEVSALSLGAMALSDAYGKTDEAEALAVLHAAFDAGITMVDTGDFYGTGHNEMLVGEALKGRRDKVTVAVKFGAQRDPTGAFIGYDASPRAVKVGLAYTLKRLRTDYVDIYMPARVDSAVPIEDTVGAIADCVKAGWVRHIGLSEAAPQTVRRAIAVHPIAALQIEYSVVERGPAEAVLPTLRELGVGMTAYGVLSRGLLKPDAAVAGPGDLRSHMPRFSGGNLDANRRLVAGLAEIARDKGITVPQLCIAWALSRGDDIVPLAGARTRAQLADALGALEVSITAEDGARIDAAAPPGAVAGTRYPAPAMSLLNG
jgi:aryl-alcohol dehydrogenase-like predicted oxidoreductase